MLDLRGVYFSDGLENELDRTMYLSNLRFGSSVIGNLGAPLGDRFPHDDLHEDMVCVFDAHESTIGYGDGEDDGDELPEFSGDPFKEGIEAPLDVRPRLTSRTSQVSISFI